MFKKVEIVLNSEGVRNLLRSKEMMSVCEKEAEKIKNKVGKGYELSKYTGTNRVNVSIVATTQEAIQDNLDSDTILKAIGSLND